MSSWTSPVPSARVAELTGGSAPPAGLDFDRQESLPGVSSCGVLHERQADLQHVVVDFELELHPQFLDTADNPLSGAPLDSGPEKATVSGLSVCSDCTGPTSELE
ncbi:unnamed protein product [Sphagnum jensenii]|uniref:Uncharacterized protein n=1 Tax=Sphagnum jensenii TaxID=128206 RepID=A0ABP1AV14_9BRYO